MAIYKVQYQKNGSETYWDFTMESDTPLNTMDNAVISAAIRDSARTEQSSAGTTLNSVRVVMITEVK